MKQGPIETNLRLFFSADDVDVTQDLLPDLLSFTYDDKETNEADEIRILLKDSDGKWAGTWKPDGGESVRAYLSKGTTRDFGLNRQELYCGRFFIDHMRVSGSPRVFELRAISVPLNRPIRRKIRTKGWDQCSLKFIAEEKAKEANLELVFDSETNPIYDRIDQNRESDLKFLSRICEDEGLSIKVTDEQLVIFDQSYYEKKPPVQKITLGESDILSWDFEIEQSETYRSCTVSYRDPKKKVKGSAGSYELDELLFGESDDGGDLDTLLFGSEKGVNKAVHTYTAIDESVDEHGQEFVLKKRAKSIGEAQRLATAKLRSLNARRITGSMTLLGDVALLAGEVIDCQGFGSFDGHFYIEQTTHSVSANGYTTTLRLRRVNNQY